MAIGTAMGATTAAIPIGAAMDIGVTTATGAGMAIGAVTVLGAAVGAGVITTWAVAVVITWAAAAAVEGVVITISPASGIRT